MGGAILIIVGRPRSLFTASCIEFSFAGHSTVYCGDSLAISVICEDGKRRGLWLQLSFSQL